MIAMQSPLKWRPSWWSEQVHGSAWERVCEAMRRDWMQTKHDLGLGGHELNQKAGDTLRQAAAKQHLGPADEPNRPAVIGDWSDAAIPYGYGYGARMQYGHTYPVWTDALEEQLAREWQKNGPASRRAEWDRVRELVRRGYEYNEATGTWGPLPPVRSPEDRADAKPGTRE
jgi:hypothetical protein